MIDKVDQIVEQNKDVWRSRSAFFSFVKGIIRKGWSRHPIKIKLLNKKRKQIPNPNPRGNKPTVWGADCAICGKPHVLKDIQVDHCSGETAFLTKQEDIQSCVEKLLLVTEDELRLLCIECHAVVSLASKQGITFEEARLRKSVITFSKLPVNEMKNVLQSHKNYETIRSVVESKTKPSKKFLTEMYEQMMKECEVA